MDQPRLLNIDSPAPVGAVRAVEQVPVVTEVVRARPVLSAEQSHRMSPDSQWGWRELRDYVVTQIEERFGAFPREQHKEKTIFEGFLNRWPGLGPTIARYAFETCEGMWRNAPVSVTRFCKNSDPYFALKIAERLREAGLIAT